MGTLSAERDGLLTHIFKEYDIHDSGELTAEQCQMIHGDMRLGGISLPQVKESMKYTCIDDVCERCELFNLLQEMDRRHFLVQDLRWEFSMLDLNTTDTITEEQAKWFMKQVHGDVFSKRKWERFLRQRAVPKSGVTFAEIEVMLCNIPSRLDLLEEEEEERKEREEEDRERRRLAKKFEEAKEKRRQLREIERQRELEEARKRREGEDARRLEEEADRDRRQRDLQESERRQKLLEEEEERGRQQAQDRDANSKKEQEEAERRRRELEEEERKEEMERRKMMEEETRRKKDLEEARDCEKLLEGAKNGEKEAEEEAERQRKRAKNAENENLRREAEEAEKRARLRAREMRNKRIRYNLKVAIKRRDREKLPPAVDDFKKAKLPDDDMDLEKAEKILREFTAKDSLMNAMKSRQLQALEQAIAYIKRHGFEFILQHELAEAEKILLQLRRLERIRAEILELKQPTVAEIKSYQKPPKQVHTVMTGTFVILGHKESEMKEWKTVQIWVGKTGKDGLKRRCLGLEPEQINKKAGRKAKDLLSQFDLDDVRDVSAGAATFYVWAWTMIEEMEARIAQDELEKEMAKKMKEEEDRLKEEAEREEKEKAEKEQAENGEGDGNTEETGEGATGGEG